MSANGPPPPATAPDGTQINTGSPPYIATSWQYGGIPAIMPDVIICAIFIACYVAAGVIHYAVFIKNKIKGQKFVMSAMTFGFCLIRTITFSTRLAWGVHPTNARLALVSNLFLNAGIPILYIINLVFVHRITRAQHPRLGWHKSLSILGRVTIGSIVLVLILLIYSGVHFAFTRNRIIHGHLRRIQQFGSTFNAFIAFLPLPILLIGVIIPKRVRTEKFGSGRFRIKVAVLLVSSSLLTIRAVYATILQYTAPVQLNDPMPPYFQKAIFYTVQLTTELIVVYMFIFVRINRIFYTPDGLPRGSYVTLPRSTAELNLHQTPPPYAEHHFPTTTTLRVYSEEELFEDQQALAETLHYSSTSLLLDNQSGKWRLERASNGDVYSPSMYQYQASDGPSRRTSWGSNYYYSSQPQAGDRKSSTYYDAPIASGSGKERRYSEKGRRESLGAAPRESFGAASRGRSGYASPGNGQDFEMKKYRHTTDGAHLRSASRSDAKIWPLDESDMLPPRLGAGDSGRATPEHLRQVGAGSNFQDRVEQVMRDSRVPSGAAEPLLSGHASGSNTPRARASSWNASMAREREASQTRNFSPPSPVPAALLPRPERAVSQPPKSPNARQSFEDV